jgi:hypothetical protein
METERLKKYRELIKKSSVGMASPEEILSQLDRLRFQMTEEERRQAPPVFSNEVTD